MDDSRHHIGTIQEDNMLLESLNNATKLVKSNSVFQKYDEKEVDFIELDNCINSQCMDNFSSLKDLILYMKNDIDTCLNVIFVLGTSKEKLENLVKMLD